MPGFYFDTMMKLKTNEEIEMMRKSALLVSSALAEVAKVLKPGITTLSIDVLIGNIVRDYGAIPSFLNFHGYPFNSCISVNDVVVHGFPSKHELNEGDLVSIDIGIYKNGFHGDHAYTFLIGHHPEEVVQLVKITKESLYKGICLAGDLVCLLNILMEVCKILIVEEDTDNVGLLTEALQKVMLKVLIMCTQQSRVYVLAGSKGERRTPK